MFELIAPIYSFTFVFALDLTGIIFNKSFEAGKEIVISRGYINCDFNILLIFFKVYKIS